MRPVVWFAAPALRGAGNKIAAGELTSGTRGAQVSSLDELKVELQDPNVICFVDSGTLGSMGELKRVPRATVAVSTESLTESVKWLSAYPWLGHISNTAMLEHALARKHFQNVLATVQSPKPRLLDWIGDEVQGRRVRLTHAHRRGERLDKMTEYLGERGVGARLLEQVRDACEELLTNAFYDAPVAAGLFDKPISREMDVELPEKAACDLGYGAREDLAIIRVKDPFGAFSRKRLVEVLMRCARTDGGVQVDESMGGAGLGMWRIFSAATFVAISVRKGAATEILLGFATKRSNPKPFAIDLFFQDDAKQKLWTRPTEETINPALHKSVLIELELD